MTVCVYVCRRWSIRLTARSEKIDSLGVYRELLLLTGRKEFVLRVVIKIYINNFIVYNKMPYLFYKYTKLSLCTLNLSVRRETRERSSRTGGHISCFTLIFIFIFIFIFIYLYLYLYNLSQSLIIDHWIK